MADECLKLSPDTEFSAHHVVLSIEALNYTCQNERTLKILNKFPALYYEKVKSKLVCLCCCETAEFIKSTTF